MLYVCPAGGLTSGTPIPHSLYKSRCHVVWRLSLMLTTTGAGRRTARLVPSCLAAVLLLVALVLPASTYAAQAAPAASRPASEAAQQQPRQPAPPLPGSAQNQMTEGTGPNRQAEKNAGGEATLKLPDLSTVQFTSAGIDGHTLLEYGLIICALGMLFGIVILVQLKNLPVHRVMREVSDLIYETCKTYLITQGKFIMLLWVFIAVVIGIYFGKLAPVPNKPIGLTLPIILLFSLIGIAGSYGVAWFGIRVNTYANSRTAFAGLAGKPFPIMAIPLQAGMSIGMLLVSVELVMMLVILLFVPGDYAGPCFIGFAIGESLGAAALRIAGGIFTKIADIGSDLMKIVFKIKEDDARNPGVIADCTGDNAGDSVG